MPAQNFYLVGRDPNTAREFDVDTADGELKTLRTTIAKDFHIIESKGSSVHNKLKFF